MKRRGLTLVEIIVSIAILGIIATGFIGAFSNYFSWMIFTKNEITIDSFESQKVLESRISEIKNSLSYGLGDPSPDLYNDIKDDLMLFEDKFPKETFTVRENIKMYVIEVEKSENQKIVSWVGETRMPGLPVPVLNDPTLNFIRNSTVSTDPFDKFEYYNFSNLTMYGATSIKENPGNSFYRNHSIWYVSEPGFLIPMPSIDELDMDYDLGRIYPSFPDNYVPIPIYSPLLSTANNSTLLNSILRNYQDRHIIYTITPYSKDLKRGILKASFPLYVMGPSTLDGLVVHLDASKIRYMDSELIEEDLNYGYMVKLWKNLRTSPILNSSHMASQSEMIKRPVLVSDIPYGNPGYLGPELPFQGEGTQSPRIWGRALGNNSNNEVSSMNIDYSFTIDNTNNSNRYSIFVVMRKVDDPFSVDMDGPPIIRGISSNERGWSINWVNSSENLELNAEYIPETEEDIGLETPKFSNEYKFESGEWSLLNIEFENGKMHFDLQNLTKGKENVYFKTDSEGKVDFYEISTTNIEMNFNGIEIAEILIYENIINDDTVDNIKDQIINKYNN